MRRLGLALLAAAAGCNQIFGLNATQTWDAAPFPDIPDAPIDAPPPHLTLTGQRLVTATGGDGSGDTIEYAAIAGATVKYGKLGQPLQDATVAADGGFDLPYDLPSDLYRVVYQVPGDLETEVHLQLGAGHLVAGPAWGREMRTAPPNNSYLEFDPSGTSGNYAAAPFVVTTGLWATNRRPTNVGSIVDVKYSDLTSLSGPLGAVEGAKGDAEVLVDSSAGGGFAVMAVDQLAANQYATAASTWKTTPVASTQVNWTGDTPSIGRLTTAANTSSNLTKQIAAGAVPSAAMPGFAASPAGGLPDPVLLTLSTSSASPVQWANPFNGTDAPALPVAILRRSSVSRTTSGTSTVTLVSGLQEIALADQGAVTIAYDAGLATAVKLGGVGLSGADGQTVALGGATQVGLTFETDKPVELCVVTLYQLSGTAIAAKKRYVMTQAPSTTAFPIDASDFEAAQTYVLGITCAKGYPGAAQGDFSKIGYPFSTATVYAATFSVTP